MGGEIQSMRVDVHMRWIGRRLILSLIKDKPQQKGNNLWLWFFLKILGVDSWWIFQIWKEQLVGNFWSFLSIYIWQMVTVIFLVRVTWNHKSRKDTKKSRYQWSVVGVIPMTPRKKVYRKPMKRGPTHLTDAIFWRCRNHRHLLLESQKLSATRAKPAFCWNITTTLAKLMVDPHHIGDCWYLLILWWDSPLGNLNLDHHLFATRQRLTFLPSSNAWRRIEENIAKTRTGALVLSVKSPEVAWSVWDFGWFWQITWKSILIEKATSMVNEIGDMHPICTTGNCFLDRKSVV